MKSEEELIPFHVSPLPRGPYLVLAPHPDDETMGMGGTIALAAKAGTSVTVVIVTDGSAGGDAETRKAEAQKAAGILGVDHIVFGGVRDRNVAGSGFIMERLPELVKKYGPGSIFIPSFLEYHPDHRAVAVQAVNCLRQMKYPGNIFAYEITRQSEINYLVDVTRAMGRKKEAMLA